MKNLAALTAVLALAAGLAALHIIGRRHRHGHR